ncbi:MAG: UDP-3-O-(3-hydroxymyristoyl)glucosamine N-acyltransferase, partial [Kamptonema sp. SIO4C4]|nr:UDP-3-O-(3-hydroxymyristoyl)glucosamine N-acyltransferase [Kamptonema sp. SIO4C4]
ANGISCRTRACPAAAKGRARTGTQQASQRGIAWVATNDPRLLFARVTQIFYQPYRPAPKIHPTAVIDETVQLGKDVSIGANVVIQPNVVIGDGVCLFPNVTIYPEVEIGDRTLIHANCSIEERTIIGKDCIIHSGVVIGSEGFGFVPSPTEGWVKMEQMGRVVLEDGVDVGSNSTIDRPSVGETRIGYNTKIDNLVQIGHGCTIGQNCALSSQVGLSGKVTVGNQVLLAGQVGVANRVTIGDGAIATAKSGLHKDVPPKAIVSGYPAIPNKLWLKISAVYNRLPEMYKLFRKLSKSS